MENTLPTCGQLERQISQTLQSIYRQQFGHLITKVTCNLFGDKLAITAEDTVTMIEKTLLDNSQPDLAYNLRKTISKIFATQIKQTIADILQVEVVDIVSDSSLDRGYLGILVFLNDTPQTRLSRAKSNKNKVLGENKVIFKSNNSTQLEEELALQRFLKESLNFSS